MRRHFICFHPLEREILLRNGIGMERLKLEGNMRLSFSGERECIGYRGEEAHFECPNRAINTKQCSTCSFRDISRIYTVGDFSNYHHIEDELEKETYCVYLAGFGEDIVKCGITRKERLKERFLEQGADFGCCLMEMKGPAEVYGIEKRMQLNFGFANAVFMKQKTARLEFEHGKGRENFEKAVKKVRETGVFGEFLWEGEVIELEEKYPKVRRAEESDNIFGEVLGNKGALLFWKGEEGKEYFTNMKNKEGRFIE